MSKVDLKLDWCSRAAAKYAVEHWHYSKCLPAGKLITIGVWENEKFIGCVIYSRGANKNLLKPYGLSQIEGCELTRMALDKHSTEVSKVLSIATRILKKHNHGLRLIVSFADDRQNHIGAIYQANGWIYTGHVESSPEYFVNGRWQHQRNLDSLFGTIKGNQFKKRSGGVRHRYLYPLDKDMRSKIDSLRKPYPKRATSSDSAALAFQAEEGGASPTVAL